MTADMDSKLAIDTAVLLLYFIVIISIGLYMGRKEESLKDFALGGRAIPWWAVLASIIAAETSAGTFFGTPGEGFALRNYTYLQLALGTILARILVSYIFIKPYYDYKVYSIYEYLTARFGVPTKNAASAIFMFTRVLASGARLYVAAIALALAYEMIRGVQPGQKETLLIYVGATIAIVILTAIYTTLGGIKAVIWTDFIQASIMIGSALAAVGLLYSQIPGGWDEIVKRHGGFGVSDFFTTGLDPAKHGWDKIKGMFEVEYTIFAGLIGSTFITMSTHGTDQDMVQRMLTAPDIRRSRRSLILSGLADIPIVLTFLTIGLLLWAYYQAHPDPTLPKTPNETFCHFILYQNAGWPARAVDRGNFRYRHGLAQHSDKRTGHKFHARLVRAIHQSTINRGTKPPCRPLGHGVVFDPDDYRRIDDFVSRHRPSEGENHPNRARNIRLHVRIAARRFPMRDVHQAARQRLGNIIAMIIGFIRRRDFEWSAEQHCRPARRKVVHAAELAAGDGISLVDLLRHHRHVFHRDFVSKRGGQFELRRVTE